MFCTNLVYPVCNWVQIKWRHIEFGTRDAEGGNNVRDGALWAILPMLCLSRNVVLFTIRGSRSLLCRLLLSVGDSQSVHSVDEKEQLRGRGDNRWCSERWTSKDPNKEDRLPHLQKHNSDQSDSFCINRFVGESIMIFQLDGTCPSSEESDSNMVSNQVANHQHSYYNSTIGLTHVWRDQGREKSCKMCLVFDRASIQGPTYLLPLREGEKSIYLCCPWTCVPVCVCCWTTSQHYHFRPALLNTFSSSLPSSSSSVSWYWTSINAMSVRSSVMF